MKLLRRVFVHPALALVVMQISTMDAAAQACSTPPPAPVNAAASVSIPGNGRGPTVVNVEWAVVPPGANSASTYVMEVGSSPGATDVAMFDTASTAGSFLQPVLNGSYYFRIRAANACGLSGPSPEPAIVVADSLPAGAPAARIISAEATIQRDALGNVLLIGEARGALGARPTPFVRIDAVFSAAGQPVGSEFTYVHGRARRLQSSRLVDDSTLAAGETGCFALHTNIPFAQAATGSVSLSTSWGTASALEALTGTVVINTVQNEADAFGNLKVSGTTQNIGPTATYFNQVVIDVKSAQNRPIDCDVAFVNGSTVTAPDGTVTATGLAPGEAGTFLSFNRPALAQVGGVITWTEFQESEVGALSIPSSWRAFSGAVDESVSADPRQRALRRNAAIERLKQIGQ